MNKSDLMPIMALLLLAELSDTMDTMDTLKANLDTLAKNDPDHPDRVDIILTESERMVKLARLCGNWGIITANGNWTPLENLPVCILEEVAEYAGRLVKKNNQ
jgi:hypothetical protein